MNTRIKTLIGGATLLFALGLPGLSIASPTRTNGSAPAKVTFRVQPNCVALGQMVMVRVTMMGLHPGEKVAFSGPPRVPGTSGNLGAFSAGSRGTIFFRFRYAPISVSEIARYAIVAYRKHGNAAHPHPGTGLWLSNSQSLRVVRQASSCP